MSKVNHKKVHATLSDQLRKTSVGAELWVGSGHDLGPYFLTEKQLLEEEKYSSKNIWKFKI